MPSYYVAGNVYNSNDIYHFGILGQKWGIRRFQNSDGTLTPEGIERYRSGISRKRFTDTITKDIKTRGDYRDIVEKSPQIKHVVTLLKDRIEKFKVLDRVYNSKLRDFYNGDDYLEYKKIAIDKLQKEQPEVYNRYFKGMSKNDIIENFDYITDAFDKQYDPLSIYMNSDKRGQDLKKAKSAAIEAADASKKAAKQYVSAFLDERGNSDIDDIPGFTVKSYAGMRAFNLALSKYWDA